MTISPSPPSPQTISTTFVCEPFHGYVMFTFVLPLVDQSGTHTVSTPLKWTVVFNTNVNTPGVCIVWGGGGVGGG